MASLIRERAVLKPAQLNALARDLLEGSFAQVWVEGEISNFSRPASGHIYFTLKDDRAQVRCALFKQKAMYLRFVPRDGLQVLVRGRLTLYEARGDYQLVLEHMEEAGEGALRRAFEDLKSKLAAEGLFAPDKKRPLPTFIRRLGVITSPRGAAVRDVLSVLERRFPMIEVDVLPVPVQGDGAAAEIRAMLERAAASGRYDALLVTRGGGSLEDLWSFNDEALVRAIAACPIPVVAAVGHEIDFSLADFAADLRAPTPSAAAELLVPDAAALRARADQLRRRADAAIARNHSSLAQRNDQAWLRLLALRPQIRVERGSHRLAALTARLEAALKLTLAKKVERLRLAAGKLQEQHPQQRLQQARHRLELLQQRSNALVDRDLSQRSLRLQGLGRTLHSVSPFATLARGYAIVRGADGHVVRAASEAKIGDAVTAALSAGTLDLTVTGRAD